MAYGLGLAVALASACVAQAQSPAIHVGPNIQVTKALENYSMGEITLAADPVDPNHLLGCSVVYDEGENRRWTAAYLSTDGGKTWTPTLDTKRFEDSADEYCALGRDGLASYISIGTVNKKHYVLGVSRSTDGGKTWEQQYDLPMNFQGIDREALIIDATGGKYNNYVYVTGESSARDLADTQGGKNGFGVWRSRDGGKTFDGPARRLTIANHYVLEPGNSVILSDGTLVSIFGDLKNSDGFSVARSEHGQLNAQLEAVTLTEGGDVFAPSVKIDDWAMEWSDDGLGMSGIGMPTVAVDASDGPFKDSLYAVWADERSGRSAIRFSLSRDKGKTWSKSVEVDDLPTEYTSGKAAENFLPVIAVNKAGVVALMWYDRREYVGSLGWNVRVRASLDGGETWSPSVKISEQPNNFSPLQRTMFTYATATEPTAASRGIFRDLADSLREGEESAEADDSAKPEEKGGDFPKAAHLTVAFQGRQFCAGDYAGLAADAGGAFHAFWIDNRTGRQQIWSSAITVDGKAFRNGSAELAAMIDVSNDAQLKILSTHFDRTSSTLTLEVQLKNPSKAVIHGPMKVRLFNLSSRLGTASPANADVKLNQQSGIWDLSRLVKDGTLKPDEASGKTQLQFHVDHLREFVEGRYVVEGLLECDLRILAASTDPAKDADTKK
jgi:hypothetical protein